MIEVRNQHQTAWITLARAQRGNALSEAMVEALIAAVEGALADPTLHTLVLDAQGDHFCTGFDLGALVPDETPTETTATTGEPSGATPLSASDGPLLWRFVRIEHLLSLLWHAPLRTVALTRGRVWGAGADLAATCDLRLCTADSQWRFPGAGFGIVLGTRRLAALVGQPRALRWVAEGQRIDAVNAVEAGLANAILASLPTSTEQLPALSVDRNTYARLKAATRPDLRDADLAALVQSAAQPGLTGRLLHYRRRSAKTGGSPP